MPDRSIRRDVFVKDGLSFGNQSLLDLFDVAEMFVSLKSRAHPLDGPEKIYSSGTSLTHHVADVLQVVLEICHGSSHRLTGAESDAHCGCDADRRRSANYHLPDGFRDFIV